MCQLEQQAIKHLKIDEYLYLTRVCLKWTIKSGKLASHKGALNAQIDEMVQQRSGSRKRGCNSCNNPKQNPSGITAM